MQRGGRERLCRIESGEGEAMMFAEIKTDIRKSARAYYHDGSIEANG